ncbi:TonB-dependent receptor [Fulvivirgaceae bacterium BMA12]|uniref:TonB-dependent receptor n=1 Tax=Agaribacillus aureus TaxID=3051825 RepID=A0ABT8LI93_9BACT|nr:TonB-dependent receptor [Fulvivirgaceae bacterium BMA12]
MMQNLPSIYYLIFTFAAALLISVPIAHSQETSGTITGVVKDLSTGEALPGVNVLVKNSSTGTITDNDGKYTLTAAKDAVLVFSFIGYISEEIQVGGRSVLDITLSPDLISLQEIVVVGYGKQSKETLTGSISSVKGKELVRSPQPNLSSSFAGRVPGVIALNRSGEPGVDGATLRIRGISTPGNNNPLVVIDGVANRLGGLERLDPNDIESISVLKDASAAIYGSQAANGVILVTTKRGQKGKPVFSFSYNQGFVKPTTLPDMADAPTYARIINEINYYRNPNGGMNQIYSEDEIALFRNGSDPDNYPNSNWVDASIRNVALQDTENLSVRGGGEKMAYFVSLGRVHQESIYEGGITEFDQVSFRTNLDLDLTEHLKVGLDVSARREERLFPTTGAGGIFRAVYRTYPTIPIRYANGLPSPGVESGANPLVLVSDLPGTDRQPSTILNTMLNFEYKLPFFESLSLKGFYAEDRTFGKTKKFSVPFTVYQINNSTNPPTFDEVIGGPDSGTPELFQQQTNQLLKTANISINFEKGFDKHFVKAFVAYEQQEDDWDRFDAFRSGFLSAEIPEFNLGGGEPEQSSNSGFSRKFTRRNYFGRISYDYDQKYLAEVQFRYDGSSRFADGNRFGFFPSVSLGWRISEESWFDVAAINNLKLRGSYGELGNDRVDAFQYLNSFQLRPTDYISSTQTPLPIFIINQLANPSITWETARKLDIGLEMDLFKHFSIELDYFSETREDLLTARQGSLPLVSGIVNERGAPSIIPQENIGEVENKGFEALVNYQQEFGDVQLFATANFTYNKNKVVFLDDAEGAPDYQLRKGRPLGSELLYEATGLFKTQEDLDNNPTLPGQQLGDLMYRDVDGDGEITALDRVRQDITNVPQMIYGVTLGGSYKNFDLTVLLQGQGRSVQYVLAESGEVGNFFSSWADNRWSPDNPDGTYPRVDVRTSSSINGGLNRNDFWLQNTSFLRIKNVELGYNISGDLLGKVGFQSARIYVSGFNVATFTKAEDVDPEGDSGNGQFYPQQKIFNVGVNVKF